MNVHRAVWLCLGNILIVQVVWCGPSSPMASAVNANNFFAFELFAQLESSPGNFVYSPLSIDTSLAMIGVGAGGTTARQISNVLHLNMGDPDAYLAFASLRRELNHVNAQGGCQFEMANALWAQQNYPFLKPFQKAVSDQFDSSLNLLDLNGWPGFDPAKAAAAHQLINGWVARKTHGKIPTILPDDLPGRTSRLILTDANWFQGVWTHSFDPALTKDGIFLTDDDQPVHVPMMQTSAVFACALNDEFVMLDMPYVSNQFSMVIVLPALRQNTDTSIPNRPHAPWDLTRMISFVLNRLDQTNQMKELEVNLSFPKFKEMSKFDLTQPLQSMGMTDAFSNDADFSKITPAKPFFIQAFLHQASIDVNEQGTVAAAATAVLMSDGVGDPGPLSVRVDHPFLFMIRHNATGAIFYMGRISDPTL